MQEKDLDQFKKRSIGSVFTLTGRSVILQVINSISLIFITIFLERKEFGLFYLISTMIDSLGYFSDVGLAAALIQKKGKLTLKEIRSTFAIQQMLVVFLIIILFIFSPLVKGYYKLDQEGMLLLYVFAFSFFLSSLKTIPSVLLERKLKFKKIVIPQFVETISFNLVVIILAWKGFGIRSYIWGVFLRGFLGTVTLYLIAPWKIGLNFSFKVLKRLFKFGVPYQLNTLLAVVKDKFIILLLGGIIGSEGVALIGWAEKWAVTPLRYFLDNTCKVAFPAFAKLQASKEKLKIAIEKTFYFLSFSITPSLIGIALIAQPLINIIPRYLKWQPALIALYLYCFSSAWGGLAVFLTTILNAIGKIKTTFKLMIILTILSWLFTPVLAVRLGYIGVPISVVIVNLAVFYAVINLRKYIKIDYFSQLKGPLAASAVMMALVLYLRQFIPQSYLGILLIVLIAVVVYFSIILLIDRKRFFKEIAFLKRELLRSKNK